MTNTEHTGPWLFLGAGNMATAIAAGAFKAGTMKPATTAAFDPNASRSGPIESVFDDAEAAADWLSKQGEPGGIVLATKPQMFEAVASVWEPILRSSGPTLVASILAGTRSETLAAGLGQNARVVRVMPNTPIRLGLGMSAVAPGPRATPEDLARIEKLFGSIGETVRIEESQMDAFTGVAGSGPAYVFYLAEAMVDAAMKLGFDRGDALTMVRQTVAGAGALLAGSADDPGALRTAVTSKAGTTAAATDSLDELGVHEAVVRAIHAARDRGIEISQS
ncbi:MAG: pyrroline-5-carboxylate reductase [Phycisphaerales bacterium]